MEEIRVPANLSEEETLSYIKDEVKKQFDRDITDEEAKVGLGAAA